MSGAVEVSRVMTTKGHSAVRAMKKPAKLSEGTELFPTPPWAPRALMEIALPRVVSTRPTAIWEPCAGLGHMAEPLREYAYVHATDVHLYELARRCRPSMIRVATHSALPRGLDEARGSRALAALRAGLRPAISAEETIAAPGGVGACARLTSRN